MAAGFGGAAKDDDRVGAARLSGTRAERYQVILHVGTDTLKERDSGAGRSHLEDGTRVL